MLYVVPKRVGKGVIIRGDVELDSPEIATLPPGTALTVYRSKHASDGKVRLKIKAPVVGWLSEKSVERDESYQPPSRGSAYDENAPRDENGMTAAMRKSAAAAAGAAGGNNAEKRAPEKFRTLDPLRKRFCETPEDYMDKLKWTQTTEPGEVELTLKMNPGTRKEDIDVIFNYQRLRIFVGASEKAILDDRLFNPILTEGCTWTYNERSRKLEISMTKDSDTVVWCAAFIYKDADGNLPTINEDHEAERTRMERFLPKRS